MASVPAPTKVKVKVGYAKFDILSRSLQMVYQLGDVVGCFLLWRLQPIFLFVSRPDRFSSTLCIAGEGLQACVAWGIPPAQRLLDLVVSSG